MLPVVLVLRMVLILKVLVDYSVVMEDIILCEHDSPTFVTANFVAIFAA